MFPISQSSLPKKRPAEEENDFFMYKQKNPHVSIKDKDHPMWKNLVLWKLEMLIRFEPNPEPNAYFRNFDRYDPSLSRTPREQKAEKLKEIISLILGSQGQGSLQILNRDDRDNIYYSIKSGMRLKEDSPMKMKILRPESVKKFVTVAIHVHELIKTGNIRTKRDLYYLDREFYTNPRMVDDAVDDIAAMLDIPRVLTGVVASADGIFFGDLTYKNIQGDTFYCLNKSMTDSVVPHNPGDITEMTSKTARFVLIVESEASYRDLVMRDKIQEKMNCIVITGRGYPDVATRHMVNLMYNFLKIPIFCLVDGDPHGFEIMCMYRFGSWSAAYDGQHLATPAIKWLGFCPSHIRKYKEKYPIQFTERVETMSKTDKKKLGEMMDRSYCQVNPTIAKELAIFEEDGLKVELQSFLDIHPNFLGSVYVQEMITKGNYI